MTILTLPPCPVCQQSSTGVYFKRLGCARCGRLGLAIAPTVIAVPTIRPVPA